MSRVGIGNPWPGVQSPADHHRCHHRGGDRRRGSVARDYGVSKGWVSKLIARYRTEGDTAFEAPLTATPIRPAQPLPRQWTW